MLKKIVVIETDQTAAFVHLCVKQCSFEQFSKNQNSIFMSGNQTNYQKSNS